MNEIFFQFTCSLQNTGRILCWPLLFFMASAQRLRNILFASSIVSLISWGKGASIAFIGHLSIHGMTMKYFMKQSFNYISTQSFLNELVKTESKLLNQLILTQKNEHCQQLSMMLVHILFYNFSDQVCHLEEAEIGVSCATC